MNYDYNTDPEAFKFQAIMDAMTEQWRKERSETQMTLGKLIEILEKMSDATSVPNLINPHSYRGYYSDLAFEKGEGLRLAKNLLADCKAAMGNKFEGYKGGDFYMNATTPVWVADYGACGNKLIDIYEGGIETREDEY